MCSKKSTMASGEREQVLADFQACTQLSDIETCIAILEQHDWNLLKAVQSVMPESHAEFPTSGVPPPIPPPVSRSPGEDYFSSGIFSDPIPWRTGSNVFDSASGFDPGSASGPGPGTSTGYGTGASRMLHFKVEYRDRNIDVFLKDTDTVGKIKEVLSSELNIPVSKQDLKGWTSRKVHDNSVLKDLHLPKETTLFLLAPGCCQSTDSGAGPSRIPDSSSIEALRRTYTLNITKRDGSKYEQLKLKFPGTQTVHEVKQDVYKVTDIPVRHQIWIGWPEKTEDSEKLGLIGLNHPTQDLELKKSNLARTNVTQTSTPTGAIPMEVETLSDDDDFPDPSYDESEIFSHEDHFEAKRSQAPMMPESVQDEMEALEHFTREFRERYGECHPVFYVGSLDNAIKDSLLCSAKETVVALKVELFSMENMMMSGVMTLCSINHVVHKRKQLALYLHYDGSIFANVFCSQTLCNEGIVNYLTNNFMIWAWDLTVETNADRLITMLTRHFGSVAATQVRGYKPDNLPVLLIISRSRASNEVVDVIRGDASVDELMTRLIQDHEVFAEQQEQDIEQEAEREARSMIRNQQDVAYQMSLEADRKKQEARLEEERRREEEERREQMKKEEENRLKLEEEAVKQAIRKSLAKKIPDEPPEDSDKPLCQLRIRTPSREILERRFYASNKLVDVLNYITAKGFHRSEHKLLTTFPRRDLTGEDSNRTLEDLKLCPQETLILEEKT